MALYPAILFYFVFSFESTQELNLQKALAKNIYIKIDCQIPILY